MMDNFQIKGTDGKSDEVWLNGVKVENCTRCEIVITPGENIRVLLEVLIGGSFDVGGDIVNVEIKRNDLLDLE